MDSKGRLWCGSEEDGLALFEENQVWIFSTENGLNNTGIGQIFEDYEGNIWLNSRISLVKFESFVFSHRRQDMKLSIKQVLRAD